MASSRSYVQYFPGNEGHRCGYCNSENTNCSHGMWANGLTVQDYQDLIDRGWRRSGCYCYKPTMNKTCCPQNTIKCAALDFKMSKSHKKIIKQVNRYLIHGIKRESNEDKEQKTDGDTAATAATTKAPSMDQETDQTQKPTSGKGNGADPTLPKCKKAKQLRAEKKNAKILNNDQQASAKDKGPVEKSLEDFLTEPDKASNPAHKLEIKLVTSYAETAEYAKLFKESHRIYHKYQMSVHNDPPQKPSQSQYKRFLCSSPLMAEKEFGSFHQQYILDGKIIAVGVIDILPTCVSSVYLYYDPDYSFLSLGTYTALQEIAFVREIQKREPDLKNYYMGFYIHSCPKMRYKGQYFPSFLVCPETFAWVPLEKCTPKLETAKYAKLDDENHEDEDSKIDLNKVLVVHKRQAMPYAVYLALNHKANDQEVVKEYAELVGKTCAERMLLDRS